VRNEVHESRALSRTLLRTYEFVGVLRFTYHFRLAHQDLAGSPTSLRRRLSMRARKLFLGLVGLLLIRAPATFAQAHAGGDARVFAIREVTLKAGVTAQEFERYFANEYARPRESAAPGLQMYLLKGDRGQARGQYLMVWEFESLTRRNEYFPSEDGAVSERLQELLRPVAPHRLGDYIDIRSYTDYVVFR
jgi:hypothetical protein